MKLEFAYDYMGRRIFKKVYNGETLEKHLSFVYDGYKLIEERNALDNNAAVRKYVWQPEALDRDVPLTVYDVISEKTYYYHTDANKNVTELSDESGNVVAHYEYSPFGSLTKAAGDYAANNPFHFSSEYFDEETGLVYYNYRYYNPELGRWISQDPIEEQGGYNLYGMIGNNPLSGWDYLGFAEGKLPSWSEMFERCICGMFRPKENFKKAIENTKQPFEDAYDTLKKNPELADFLARTLWEPYDWARLLQDIANGRATPYDYLAFAPFLSGGYGRYLNKVDDASPPPSVFSGTDKPWTTGATPNSKYTQVDANGKPIQTATYNQNGDVVTHVDYKQHGSAPPGHGHYFSEPGNPSSGHGKGAEHIMPENVPDSWK